MIDWYTYYKFDKSALYKRDNESVYEYFNRELKEHIESLPNWFANTKVTSGELLNKMKAIEALVKLSEEHKEYKEAILK